MIASVFVFFIKVYKVVFSFKKPCCRYIPSCSVYAIEAIEKYGALKGAWLALKRILRCRPSFFNKYANCGYDPVP